MLAYDDPLYLKLKGALNRAKSGFILEFLSPKADIGNLGLSDILELEEIRPLMNDFYKLTQVPAAIMDNSDNILVSNGMQDVCAHFHWAHSEANRFCPVSGSNPADDASQIQLSRCKNSLWDLAAPIWVNGRQVGRLMIGQFLLEEEEIDIGYFKKQPEKYGFNEEEYLAALKKAPRIDRGTLEVVISFYIKLTQMLSKSGYRNVQLARSLMQNFALLSNISDVIVILDEHGTCRYSSPNTEEKLGQTFEKGENLISLKSIHPDDRKKARMEFEELIKNPANKKTVELRHIGRDAKYHTIELTGVNLINDPNVNGVMVSFHDITERKKREEQIVYLNEHNTLTGLYNRRFFDEQVKKMDQKENLPLSFIMGDINGLKMINDALGHAEGDKMIVEISKILKNCIRKGDVLAQTGGDEFSILLPCTGSRESYELIKKINKACREHKTNSEIYYISISMGYSTKTAENEFIGSKIKEAEDNMYKHKLLEHKSLHSSVISSIKRTMMEKDFQTEEHAERLALLSSALGQALHITDQQMDELQLLSTLHDIGKIVVEDKILKKDSRLTEQEWEQMKKHPEVGYRIAMASPELNSIANSILSHHERWDGRGYPQGLAGEEIPLLSRIIAVTDSYDAMTQDRPYRKAMTREQAVEEICKNAGSQFDPRIARIFVEEILLNEDY